MRNGKRLSCDGGEKMSDTGFTQILNHDGVFREVRRDGELLKTEELLPGYVVHWYELPNGWQCSRCLKYSGEVTIKCLWCNEQRYSK